MRAGCSSAVAAPGVDSGATSSSTQLPADLQHGFGPVVHVDHRCARVGVPGGPQRRRSLYLPAAGLGPLKIGPPQETRM